VSKVKIGRLQLIFILANLVYGKSIGFTGGILARRVGNDSWLSMLLAFVGGALVMVLMVQLARRVQGQDLFQYLPRLLGTAAGKLAQLLLGLFFLGVFVASAVTIEHHINDFLMPDTPFIVFVVIYTVLTAYGVYLGIETAARFSLLGYLGGIAIAVSMMLGSTDTFDLSQLMPVLDHGAGPVATASLVAATDVLTATAAVIFLLPLTGEPKCKWLPICWWGLALGAAQTIVWPIYEVGVLGAEVTAQYMVACMELARGVQLGIYLQRYELIMVSFFSFAVFVQSLVSLWLAVKLISSVFGSVFGSRPSNWAYWVIGISLATIPGHYWLAYQRDLYIIVLANVWTPVAIVLALGLPLVIYAVSLVRRVPEEG